MQTTPQEKEKNKKQMLSLAFLALSITIGFFFTMDQGYGYIEKKDALETSRKEASDKKQTLEKLQNMSKDINNNTEVQKDIERYGSVFREDTILDSIFAPINGVSIANISMSKGEKSPNGLSIADINLSLKAEDIPSLNNYLDYLTSSKTNKKSYIIKNLSFPFDSTKNEPISASLTVGMYYFE